MSYARGLMPAERYFFSGKLHLHEMIELGEREFHHLIHVMRAKSGDHVELVNGQGNLALALLKDIKKEHAQLEIIKIETAPLPSIQVILAQAIPRLNRLDDILEKGTELGMDELWLFPGEESERKEINAHQFQRLEAIMTAAMKQCGRLWLPKLLLKKRLSMWEKPKGELFYGDPEGKNFFKAWNTERKKECIVFFVGPEKGFTRNEEALFKKWEAQGVRIAQNILRTDTAAIAALTLMGCMIKELGSEPSSFNP